MANKKIHVLDSLTEPLPLWEAAKVGAAEQSGPLAGEGGEGPELGKEGGEKRMGLFVDAQNVRLEWLGEMIERLGEEGKLTVRRAFGHWPEELDPDVANVHLKHAIELRQCPRLTHMGKNAADIAMVVDVMDVLGREELDVFVLVSSDSDFTPVVQHLKRAGKEVIGVGLDTAPESLQAACSRFEVIEGSKPEVEPGAVVQLRKAVWSAKERKAGGWKILSEVGKALAEEGLVAQDFGRASLSRVCRERSEFELQKSEGDGGWYVRLREQPTTFSEREEDLLRAMIARIREEDGWVRIDQLAEELRDDDSWEPWKHQGKWKKKLLKLGWLSWSEDDPLLARMEE